MVSPLTATRPTARQWLASIDALLAGFIVVVVLSIGTDIGLRETSIFRPLGQPMSDALFLLATIYRTVYAIAGSYITARLAPIRPMLHALVGGAFGLVLSLWGLLQRGTAGQSSVRTGIPSRLWPPRCPVPG